MVTSTRFSGINYRMILFYLVALAFIHIIPAREASAQIWEPEGLNLPGAWNGWTNPPANNLALASYTQVTGGRVTRIPGAPSRWQTIFSVAETGGDVVGGTYAWLFSSGPSANPWNNKWADVVVTINTLQIYTYQNGPDNSITVTNGKWYTMNFEDAGYSNTQAIFMETSAQPVDITSLSVPSSVNPGDPVAVTVTTSLPPCTEELFYLRYTTDAWVTSASVMITMTGTSGTATIPGMSAGTTVEYYAFSSVIPAITENHDLLTIKSNTNSGVNYAYTVSTPPVVITFANLQGPPSGTIEAGQSFLVTGRAEIPGITGQPTPAPGIEAWVGYSATDSDPSTWTSWFPAAYTGPVSGYDEFSANLGAAIGLSGSYFYATRFRLNAGTYLYGGYSATGGGFWNGTGNNSGTLTVEVPLVPMQRTLTNVTIAAEEQVCYDAKATITVAGNGTYFNVLTDGSVTLIAGQNILLLPGTNVSPGGYLLGKITSLGVYCNTPGAPLSRVNGQDATNPAFANNLRVLVFPNPASNDINIDWKGTDATGARIELMGIRGDLIQTKTIDSPGRITFSLAGLPGGVYIIRITSGGEVLTKMVVKQ